MFVYCLNNPIRLMDLQGSRAQDCSLVHLNDEGYERHYGDGQAISISIYNQSIYIDAYMMFYGDVDPAVLIQGIKDYWEGTYSNGTYTYNVFISIHQGESINGYTITVNAYEDDFRGYCMWNPFTWSSTKESTIYVSADYYSNYSCGWTMAHEFGHSLGIYDYYTQSNVYGFNKNYDSIMNLPGAHANFYDIIKVIDANIYGFHQKWYCVGGL